MERRILPKAKLSTFLGSLHEEYRVVAPQRVGPSDVVYDELELGRKAELTFVNSLLPPKALFFPQRENLFSIRGTRQPTLTLPPAERPLAVFGMRSCDAAGLVFLEKFFGERGFDDTTVTERIRRSLRMTLACATPGPNCFCVCCEGGPFLSSGFDLQFVDLGDDFLVEVGTPKGQQAIDHRPAPFTAALDRHLAEKRRQVEGVDVLFQRRTYISGGVKRITLNKVSDEAWETLAEDCRGCGGCCYVCPTCSCFTVHDVPTGPETYERERSWDACLYSGFTREASLHNPRETKKSRLKRRFFHKLSYQYLEKMGRHGCVGCGRCAETCMGGLDISTLLERFNDVAR
jgi:ferredoxin